MSTFSALIVGLAAAAAVAAGGYRVNALSKDGAIAATLVGAAIFGLGGWRWAAVMVAFFSLSSVLSRLGRRWKQAAEVVVEKGSRRDAVQVLANGGIAGLIALGHGISPGSDLLFPAYLGSMAAATADTWSTEIGALSASAPRSIVTGKFVSPGASGGVTTLGLLGALLGAAVIGLVGGAGARNAVDVIFVGVFAGYTGSVVDSLLGASVQRVNRCPRCLVLTERQIHDCGTRAALVHGFALIDNDVVNGLTTLYGAICGGLLFLLVR